MTAGVNSKGPEFVAKALIKVIAFNDFTADNDPHGEHDFGSFELDGEKLFWKIDYFDLAAELRTNPTDPSASVLTVMLAEEYELLLPAPRFTTAGLSLLRLTGSLPGRRSPIGLRSQIEQFLSSAHDRCI